MKRFLILLFVLTMLKHANSQQWSFEFPCEKDEYAHFMAGDKSLCYNYVEFYMLIIPLLKILSIAF